MRIPMKVDYGVRALVDLAGQPDAHRPVRTADIAGRQGIPEPYLDQVLTTLNKFGLIASRRGPQGGHVLARAASDITLDEVVATLDGRNPPLECIDDATECALSGCCAQRDIWRDVEEAIHAVLTTTTIADLAQRQQARTAAPLTFVS
jgi:Rrf2 family protein